jgi:uncharacterized membrane protein (UPF0127 family)
VNFVFSSFAILLALIFGFVGCAANSETKVETKKIEFKTAELKIGGKTLNVELAQTPQQRAQGLMHRTELKEGTGMLFIFNRETPQSFWMKNTLIPLSIGYFDKAKKLVRILKMNPESKMVRDSELKRYSSGVPVLFALEVPQGWFEKNKIKVGETFELKPGQASADE